MLVISSATVWDRRFLGCSPSGPSYIKTGSHSGTSIWEAGAGSTAGGSMIVGPGNVGGGRGILVPDIIWNSGNATNAGSVEVVVVSKRRWW